MADYSSPVAGLLNLGDEHLGVEWLDYRAGGIGPEHVPELIRLAQEWVTADEDDVKGAALYAPIHAWRALGQLRAAEASEALLEIVRLDIERDGDWASEDMPEVFGKIGPPALPPLAAVVGDRRLDVYVRWNAANALTKIAQQHPEARAESVALLVAQLEQPNQEEEEDTLKGAIISCLLDLNAVEAAPAIEKAFAANEVDESIAGDWEEVRFVMGLGPPPRSRTSPVNPWAGGGPGLGSPGRSPKSRAKERSRNKRKQAKQSKKKNRKKK